MAAILGTVLLGLASTMEDDNAPRAVLKWTAMSSASTLVALGLLASVMSR